jgi:hypothetical protein
VAGIFYSLFRFATGLPAASRVAKHTNQWSKNEARESGPESSRHRAKSVLVDEVALEKQQAVEAAIQLLQQARSRR